MGSAGGGGESVERVRGVRGSGEENDQGVDSQSCAEGKVGEGEEGGDEREPAGGRLSGKKSQAREKTEEAGESGHDDGCDVKDVENSHESERVGDAGEERAKHHSGCAAV